MPRKRKMYPLLREEWEEVYYYNSKILELINKKNLISRLIQKNSIENFVQDCLSYIPKTNSLCSTTLAYPK